MPKTPLRLPPALLGRGGGALDDALEPVQRPRREPPDGEHVEGFQTVLRGRLEQGTGLKAGERGRISSLDGLGDSTASEALRRMRFQRSTSRLEVD